MKRILYFLVVLCIFINLTACEKNGQKAPDIADSFSTSAEFIYGEKTVTGILSRQNIGLWALEITAPDEIKGIKYTYSDGKISVSLGELNVQGGVDEQCFLLTIKAIESIDNNEGTSTTKKDGKITATGRIVGEAAEKGFDLVFNEQSLPESVVVLSSDLTVKFSGFTVEQNQQANATISDENMK